MHLVANLNELERVRLSCSFGERKTAGYTLKPISQTPPGSISVTSTIHPEIVLRSAIRLSCLASILCLRPAFRQSMLTGPKRLRCHSHHRKSLPRQSLRQLTYDSQSCWRDSRVVVCSEPQSRSFVRRHCATRASGASSNSGVKHISHLCVACSTG